MPEYQLQPATMELIERIKVMTPEELVRLDKQQGAVFDDAQEAFAQDGAWNAAHGVGQVAAHAATATATAIRGVGPSPARAGAITPLGASLSLSSYTSLD